MAVALNKTRIRDTKLALIFAAIGVMFTSSMPIVNGQTPLHEFLDMLGSILVGTCALGRLYCTAFLGGHKNQSLVTYGPFSVCRNPLYFCSFLGACGIALITNHFLLMLALPLLFCAVYFSVIRREEDYLIGHFGEPYRGYCNTTPRFFPNFSLYHVPETVLMYPKHIHKGLKDCLMWLAAFPLVEGIEWMQAEHIIPTYFVLP